MSDREVDKEECQCEEESQCSLVIFSLRGYCHHLFIFVSLVEVVYSFDSQRDACRISMAEANILTSAIKRVSHVRCSDGESGQRLSQASHALDHPDSSFN